jgi:hypothetical protein
MLTAEKAGWRCAENGARKASHAAAPAQALYPASEQARHPAPDTSLALALLRAEYARLAAAARASVAAARAGATDPLVYVEAELARHGGLPPKDMTVLAVLADAHTAMIMARPDAWLHELINEVA